MYLKLNIYVYMYNKCMYILEFPNLSFAIHFKNTNTSHE